MVQEHSEDIERHIEVEKAFLLSQALYITGKNEDAEDLFQETIMKACKGFDGFKQDTSFRAWTKKIMINTHINRSRQRMYTTIPLEDSSLNRENIFFMDFLQVATMDNPENTFFHYHISDEIMEAFNSLPDKYKTVFSLFHFDGYLYGEISKAVNVPVGTVKSRIHRARQYLTEQIHSTNFARTQHSTVGGA